MNEGSGISLHADLNESGLREISGISKTLAQFYKRKVRKEAVKKIIKEKKTEKVPVTVKKEVDKGPTLHSNLMFIFGNLAGIILLGAELYAVAVIFLLVNNVVALFLNRTKRMTAMEDVTEYKDQVREVDREVETGEFIEHEIPRNYRVRRIGSGALPFQALEFRDDRCIMSGPESLMKQQQLEFPIVPGQTGAQELADYMEKELSAAPYVLSGEKKEFAIQSQKDKEQAVQLRGYEKDLREAFAKMQEVMTQRSSFSFQISSLLSNRYVPFMYAAENSVNENEPDYAASMVVDTLKSPAGIPFDERLREWAGSWNRRQAVLHGVRYASVVNNTTPVSLDLSTVVQYSAFNFYCPECNRRDAENLLNRSYSILSDSENAPIKFSRNTRCLYEPDSGEWVCPLCDHRTMNPIPIHKTLDEVLLPAYDKLMEENKNERIRAHNDTRVREIDRTNEMEKEIETALYDQISKVYQLSDDMERLKADISGENEAIKAVHSVTEAYQMKQTAIMRSIKAECENLKTAVVQETGRVMAELDKYKNQQLQAYSADMKEISSIKKMEDEKRDALQREILQATHENTSAVKDQAQMMAQKMDQQAEVLNKTNATMAAGFKGMGANTRKRKGLLGVPGNIADSITEGVGNVFGKTSQQIEADKAKRS